ncbi:MAG TPA: hypothetical protein VK971_05805 [Thiohalobacter sp.]|nr:hypothetical protein [Thiohalobacter sp.]
MNGLKSLFIVSFAIVSHLCLSQAHAGAEDIYAVQFSADGRHLVTGGSGGNSLEHDENFSGGIKLWDVSSGKLVKAFGQQADILAIFGEQHGRVGKRRWNIHSFKDIVVSGNYPDGKVVLLPSSLGRIHDRTDVQLPDLIGGYFNLDSRQPARIPFSAKRQTSGCDAENAYEFVGPVAASDNGRYAAVVVNTCKSENDRPVPIAQYDSTLHIVDLQDMSIKRTVERLDSGIYAIGVANQGDRIAYVGRDQFAVLDLKDQGKRVIEEYPDAVYQVPRQFSTLYFNEEATRLVSLHFIYDIETGNEKELAWSENSAVNKGRTSSVSVSPDLNYFVLVKPKRSFITFDEKGLPRSYGKADKVIVVDIQTGEERELKVTDARTEGKRCATDISPDSRHVAVACAGGLIKVFDANSGNLVWEQRNVGYKRHDLDKSLIKVRHDTPAQPLYSYISAADSMLN